MAESLDSAEMLFSSVAKNRNVHESHGQSGENWLWDLIFLHDISHHKMTKLHINIKTYS
jgi:hypothetical protein